MAADNTGAKSSSAADSYVGSLISLTSKSEIRYEGILYNINTDESSIGLSNVRSFGTEGRKKDGSQVPPSDRVYEYILFRGTDIKDLQVKASPPVQPTPTVNNDPAIIQSHYPNPTPPTSSSLPPSSVTGPVPDVVGSHNGQYGMGFQNSMPLYQPSGNLGPWGPSPQPPMYWQGYYPPPPNGLPQLHQQSLVRPPQGMSMHTSLQQPPQYPNFNASLPSGSSAMQGSSLPEATPTLFPYSNSTSSQIQAPSVSPPSGPPLPLSSGLPSAPSASQASEMSPPLLSNKAPVAAPLTISQDTSLPTFSQSTTRAAEISAGLSLSNKPSAVPGPVSMPQTAPLTSASLVGGSSTISQDKPRPLLVTPGQLMQSGSAAVSLSTPSQNTDKDVEVVQAPSSAGLEQSVTNTSEAQPPILPLPASARPAHQLNGHSYPSHNGYRGGRGRGGRGAGRSSHHVMKFTEDFDFTAMNEKFNKDEVWGHLGKNTKDGDGDDEYPVEDEAELPKADVNPVYNKDDFFDSLSSNTINRDSQNARPRFSEQRKLDTETFGEFSRSRGGRGYGRNGYSRGRGYGGRGGGGYGYGGRGHVRGVYNRTF
ncbi:unnamed protein product [Thlaspi arvense]|uniref:Protein decapping 5 n=1 Tax=Thlaspi arvense TaxID=13288 RepID=A0AAU9SKH4_THLAR|nr:unnamed protein product [Thlaspi arvense]